MLAALVEYDGTEFRGFQRLRGGESVQGTLEAALSRLAGEAVRLKASGRTDGGVHALGQVVSFPGFWQRELEELQRALNALLPESVAVRQVTPAPVGFDPRRWATSRQYVYRLWNEPARSPLAARLAWHVGRPLNVEAMTAVAAGLVGERDFAALGSAPSGGSSVRRLFKAEVWRQGRQVLIHLEANAFLTGMVRRTVQGLVRIGLGGWPPQRLAEIVDSRNLALMQGLAPPHGLYLWRVNYAEALFREQPELERLYDANVYA